MRLIRKRTFNLWMDSCVQAINGLKTSERKGKLEIRQLKEDIQLYQDQVKKIVKATKKQICKHLSL